MLFPLFCLLNKTVDVSRKCWTQELEPQNREYNTEYCLDSKTVHIFAYSSTRERSNKRSRTRLKQRARLGRDALQACEAHALRARKTLTPRFSDFFTDFVKKNRLFCSLSIVGKPLPHLTTLIVTQCWTNTPTFTNVGTCSASWEGYNP